MLGLGKVFLWLGQVFFSLRVSVFSNRTSVFFINGTSVLDLGQVFIV